MEKYQSYNKLKKSNKTESSREKIQERENGVLSFVNLLRNSKTESKKNA